MRRYSLLLLSLCLLFSSCSYQQFAGVTAGSSLGGMFGSSIGGLMSGPRGSDKGTLAGMVIGGVVGAAVTAPRDNTNSSSQRQNDTAYDDVEVYNRRGNADVQYGSYNNPNYQSPAAVMSDMQYIEVTNVHFLDSNNNQCLDSNEEACLVMDIYNRGSRTLYNLTPCITCSNRRIAISPAAAIGNLQPGQGVRYKAAIKAVRHISDSELLFTVTFGTGSQAYTAKQFKIRTAN